MVACKSLREYNNNKEKIKQFCLEEKRQMNQRQQQMTHGPSNSATKTPGGENNLYSHKQMVSIAKKNQKVQQQKRRNNQRPEATVKKQQPRKQHDIQQLSPRRNRKHTMPQQELIRKTPESERVNKTQTTHSL